MRADSTLRILILLLLSPMVSAEALPWYQVELLVFAQLGEAPLREEFWSDDPGMADLSGAYPLRRMKRSGGSIPTTVSGGGAFRRLPAGQRQLWDIWNNLKRSAQYRPLLHQAWIQPGFPRDRAQKLRLTTGTSTLRAPSPRPAYTPVTIDGVVSVYLERYLHINVDLHYYRVPTTSASFEQGQQESLPPSRFRLTESRRMRLEELHYLDHPMFGVLIRIARFEPEQKLEAAAPPSSDAAAVPVSESAN